MSAIYDGAFRTMVNDCRRMLLPLLNEIFNEDYTGDEKIVFHPNEQFIDQQDIPDKRRITDTNFYVLAEKGTKNYHLECESGYPEADMMIRIFEYDAQIALENREVENETVTFTFPHSAVVYLRSRKKTPDRVRCVIITPGGKVEYNIPLLKMKEYTFEELFEKKLYLLIPFYVFFWDDEFKAERRISTLAKRMKSKVEWMIGRIFELEEKGEISGFERRTIIEVARDVFEKYMKQYRKKYKDVNREVGDLMRGPMIDTEVRRVRDDGLKEGEARGKILGYIELSQELDLSRADTKERVIMHFKMNEDEVEELLQEFWIEK